jgi:hypothetical protein
MKNVSFLNRLINGGFLLLGTFIFSKVLQYLILNYLNLPFSINPMSIIGDASVALNASSLSKYTYIFFDFVCFAFFYFTLKKARSFIRRLQRRVNI